MPTKRREFGVQVVCGAMAMSSLVKHSPSTSADASQSSRTNILMHVGGDYHCVAGPEVDSRQNLEFHLRHGVRHLTILMKNHPHDGWDLAELKHLKEHCAERGVVLEAIRMDPRYITLPQGSERDGEIDTIIANIQKAAEVGVKLITYHWTVIPIRRNRRTRGRGNSTYQGFQIETNWQDLPIGDSGRVSANDYWERIGYFLERVVPAAKRYDVRLACHPYDPPGLPFGYQGADNWDSPSVFEAIRKYEGLVDSAYNGFQLCLGTTAEGLKNPAKDILAIVEYLGQRGKIYQIHMRNVRGGLLNFEEVYPDEGEVDFFQVMRILRDVQFAGSICPDHMPAHSDDPDGMQAFSFGYGYIKALIQAVNSEVSGGKS